MKQLLKIKIVVLVIALIVIALSSCNSEPTKKVMIIHDYEYVFIVIDTPNGLVYGVFDKAYHLVGTVRQNQLDSLIISDNQ